MKKTTTEERFQSHSKHLTAHAIVVVFLVAGVLFLAYQTINLSLQLREATSENVLIRYELDKSHNIFKVLTERPEQAKACEEIGQLIGSEVTFFTEYSAGIDVYSKEAMPYIHNVCRYVKENKKQSERDEKILIVGDELKIAAYGKGCTEKCKGSKP